MIIDFHTHAWPDKIAQKAREHLEGLFRVKLVGEPTVHASCAHGLEPYRHQRYLRRGYPAGTSAFY